MTDDELLALRDKFISEFGEVYFKLALDVTLELVTNPSIETIWVYLIGSAFMQYMLDIYGTETVKRFADLAKARGLDDNDLDWLHNLTQDLP